MKTFTLFLIIFLAMPFQQVLAQPNDRFLESYSVRKKDYPVSAKEYKDIDGSPYLNKEFVDGSFYLKDTVVVKLPIRYNIYSDEMEYQLKGINYAVGNPLSINKIVFGESTFVYLPFIQKGGYFEIFEFGTCSLVQKKRVEIKPAEGPKPMQPEVIPAQFVRKADVFYMLVNDTLVFKIDNMKSVSKALNDKKQEIENFIKQEKIKNTKQENLLKIAKYYNSIR